MNRKEVEGRSGQDGMAPRQLAKEAGGRGRCAGRRLLVRWIRGTKLTLRREYLVADHRLVARVERDGRHQRRGRARLRNGSLIDRVVVVTRLSLIERGAGAGRLRDWLVVLVFVRHGAVRERRVGHRVECFNDARAAGSRGGQTQRNEDAKSQRTHARNLSAAPRRG